MITELTKENFDSEVLASQKPVLIDFWAEWCGPCKMMSPVVDEIEKECGEAYRICKVNVDDAPELAIRFNIDLIPTLLIIKNGEVAARSVGLKSKEEVLKLLS